MMSHTYRSRFVAELPKVDMSTITWCASSAEAHDDLAERLGDDARRRVIERFITPCHLVAQAGLVTRILA